jgi:hypothetical protein
LWFWYVVAVLLGFDALICLILAIPVDAVMDLDVHGKPAFSTTVTWLFGTVTLRPGGARAAGKEKQPPERHRPKRKAGVVGFWEVVEILQTRGLMNEVKKLIFRLVRSFKVKEFRGTFNIGLPDPAYTGMLYGYYMAATVPFNWRLLRDVHVIPVFDRSVIEGSLHAQVRVRPISLLGPPFLFVFSRPVLRIIKIMVVTQWRKKKLERGQRSPSPA